MKTLLQGNYAVAEAVRLARVQFVAAYPITPQTPIYERLSDYELEGKLGGLMMRTESEHSAMAACISAALTGVRTFTATASQGIALMHEMLHFASGNRVPVVMCNVNRVVALPWAFGSDQSDSLAQRDTGWMQFYCNQVADLLIMIPKMFSCFNDTGQAVDVFGGIPLIAVFVLPLVHFITFRLHYDTDKVSVVDALPYGICVLTFSIAMLIIVICAGERTQFNYFAF